MGHKVTQVLLHELLSLARVALTKKKPRKLPGRVQTLPAFRRVWVDCSLGFRPGRPGAAPFISITRGNHGRLVSRRAKLLGRGAPLSKETSDESYYTGHPGARLLCNLLVGCFVHVLVMNGQRNSNTHIGGFRVRKERARLQNAQLSRYANCTLDSASVPFSILFRPFHRQ